MLPEHDGTPRFAWVPLLPGTIDHITSAPEWSNFESGGPSDQRVPTFALPDTSGILGFGHVDYHAKSMAGLQGAAVGAGRSSYLVGRSNAAKLAPNAVVARLVSPAVAATCRGPLVLVGAKKFTAEDLDTSDFTIVLFGLGAMAKESNGALKKAEGVRVNAAPPFAEDVKVPLEHPIFRSGKDSPFSKMLGMPMRTWNYPKSSTGSSSSHSAQLPGYVDAKFLQFCVDPASPDFGTIPASVQADTASTLIVREPGMPLGAAHFTRLRGGILGLIESSTKTTGSPQQRLAKIKDTIAMANNFNNERMQELGFGTLEEARAELIRFDKKGVKK